MVTPMRTRRCELTSNLYALTAEPPFHLRLELLQLGRRPRFKAQHQDRLGVGSADQAPPMAEEHANAIDGVHIVLAGEIRLGFFYDSEFLVVGAIDPDLGRGHEARDVLQQLAHRFARVCDDAEQSRSSI